MHVRAHMHFGYHSEQAFAVRASLWSGGHFEATPPHQIDASHLWSAVSQLTLTG